MLLSQHGAQIITVDPTSTDVSCLNLNIKNKSTRKFVIQHIIPRIDIIFESFRPGVMEHLNLGPAEIHAINPNVIYVRISGYGRYPINDSVT